MLDFRIIFDFNYDELLTFNFSTFQLFSLTLIIKIKNKHYD